MYWSSETISIANANSANVAAERSDLGPSRGGFVVADITRLLCSLQIESRNNPIRYITYL
jgi:hypothetical protein